MTEQTPGFDVIRDAVETACRAPSFHNSQPWRWITDGTTLDLFADEGRLMPAADPQGREITLSCGAALDHLVLAMAIAGWNTNVQRFPDQDAPYHVARMQFRRTAVGITETSWLRADAIRWRHTDRRPFGLPSDWTRFEVKLRQAMIPYQVMFDVVLDGARPRLAEASRLTEEIRANDPSYEAELSWWTSSSDPHERVPRDALVSTTTAALVDVARDFPTTSSQQAPGVTGVDHSKIVVLSTHHEDARLDVLRCGEALSALLLECTAAGLATCTLTHMTELASSREVVRKLTGQHGLPQLLVRIGQPPAGPQSAFTTTPRRPVDEVLEMRKQPS
jgi:nitroreductase